MNTGGGDWERLEALRDSEVARGVLRILIGFLGFAAIVLVGWFILWLLLPVLSGYHIGYNAATDHECLSRIVQWCK